MKKTLTILLATTFILLFSNKIFAQDSFRVAYEKGYAPYSLSPMMIKVEADYTVDKLYTATNTLQTIHVNEIKDVNHGQATSFLAPPTNLSYAQTFNINYLKMSWYQSSKTGTSGIKDYIFTAEQIESATYGGLVSFSIPGATIQLTADLVGGNQYIYTIKLTSF